MGVDSDDENELGVLEFIHCLVETLDKVRLQPSLYGEYDWRATGAESRPFASTSQVSKRFRDFKLFFRL